MRYLDTPTSTSAQRAIPDQPTRYQPARAAAGPSHSARWRIPTWWRQGVAVLAGTMAVLVAVMVFTTSASRSAMTAYADPRLNTAIDQARQAQAARGAERPALTTDELAAQRAAALDVDSQLIQDGQQQAAVNSRQQALADTAESVQAEAERLQNLTNFLWPTDGGISSGFGYRLHPILRIRRLHNGDDIGGKCGQPIWAAQSGTVTKIAPNGYNGGSGHNVRIDHGDIDGSQIQTAYLHMDKINVKVGQNVNKGDRIGTVGTTGLSTGCHLHFTVYKNGRAIDPLPYIKK